jgi:hypothetical protein
MVNLRNRIEEHSDTLGTTRLSRTTMMWTCTPLRHAASIILSLYLSSPVFAEPREPKADDKAADRAHHAIEAEANLPIYHSPLKTVRPNSIRIKPGESKLLPLHRSQTKSLHSPSEHSHSNTDEGQPIKFSKPTRPISSNSSVPSKLDSLAQTQDKARQHVLYGLTGENHPSAFRPVLPEAQKGSIEKPVVISPPPTAINKTPSLPNNSAIWTKNDSLPHRGPGTASIGGPASVKNPGINGTEMKIRR